MSQVERRKLQQVLRKLQRFVQGSQGLNPVFWIMLMKTILLPLESTLMWELWLYTLSLKRVCYRYRLLFY